MTLAWCRAATMAGVLALSLSSGANAKSGLEKWRAKEPRWKTTTQRSLNDLEGCLGSRYVGTLHTHVVPMRIENGVSYQNDGDSRDFLVDVTDDGDHRTIKLWLRVYMGITVGAKEQIEKLGRCAHPDAPEGTNFDTKS
ncbi:hypothetical protein ACH0BU_04485 [Sphingomonas olei]